MSEIKKEQNFNNKDEIKHFSKEWYREYSDKERKLFESILLLLIPTLVLFLYTLTKEPLEDGYYKLHSALFYCCILIFLLFVIRRFDFSAILKNSWKVLTRFKSSTLPDMMDTLFLANGLIFFISILFVIDVSALSNYGVRIGAVAAFGFFGVIRSVVKSFTQFR